MLTFKDILESEKSIILNEATIAPEMQQAIKQIKQTRYSVTEVGRLFDIEFGLIDSSMIKVLTNLKTLRAKNEIKDALKDQDKIIFVVYNGIIYFVISGKLEKAFPKNPEAIPQKDRAMASELSYFSNQKQFQVTISGYEGVELWIINRKYRKAYTKHCIRDINYRGTWENTPEYYEKIAKQNVERYKKLVIDKKIKKDDFLEKYVKTLQSLSTDIYTKLIPAMDTNNPENEYKLSNILYKLGDANQYIAEIIKMKASEAGYGRPTLSDYKTQRILREEEELKSTIATITTAYQELYDSCAKK